VSGRSPCASLALTRARTQGCLLLRGSGHVHGFIQTVRSLEKPDAAAVRHRRGRAGELV
jgi:hypothetical protein